MSMAVSKGGGDRRGRPKGLMQPDPVVVHDKQMAGIPLTYG